MVNLKLIFDTQEKFVNTIITDIRKNNLSWEILQYINGKYAEVEIDHEGIINWNKEKYEQFLHTNNPEAEIRINYGYVYRYVNIHGNTEYDRDWDDTEEEWEEYRDCYEEFDGKETECVPQYIEYNTEVEV
jgi:hypothetical protein